MMGGSITSPCLVKNIVQLSCPWSFSLLQLHIFFFEKLDQWLPTWKFVPSGIFRRSFHRCSNNIRGWFLCPNEFHITRLERGYRFQQIYGCFGDIKVTNPDFCWDINPKCEPSRELVASSWCEVSSDSSGSQTASLGHWAPPRATNRSANVSVCFKGGFKGTGRWKMLGGDPRGPKGIQESFGNIRRLAVVSVVSLLALLTAHCWHL